MSSTEVYSVLIEGWMYYVDFLVQFAQFGVKWLDVNCLKLNFRIFAPIIPNFINILAPRSFKRFLCQAFQLKFHDPTAIYCWQNQIPPWLSKTFWIPSDKILVGCSLKYLQVGSSWWYHYHSTQLLPFACQDYYPDFRVRNSGNLVPIQTNYWSLGCSGRWVAHLSYCPNAIHYA